MDSIISRFRSLRVNEDAGRITIEGYGVGELSYTNRRLGYPNGIINSIFTRYSYNRWEFYSFFGPEIRYMLDRTVKEGGWAAKRAAERVIELMDANTWVGGIKQLPKSKLDYSQLKQFVYKPLPHQEEAFRRYDEWTQRMRLKGYLLNMAVGSGKTLTSLMLGEMLKVDHIVVVSPKKAIDRVWLKTFNELYYKPHTHWYTANGKPYNGERYLLTHYETLPLLVETVKRLKGRVFVILDECHNLNEIKSQRTQSFIELCKLPIVQEVLWMSGTPLKAMGYEVIPLMTTIDPLFNDAVAVRYRKAFNRGSMVALEMIAHRLGLVSYKIEGEVKELKHEVEERELPVVIPNGERYTLSAVKEDMKAFILERSAHYQKNMSTYQRQFKEALEYHRKQLRDNQMDAFNEYCRNVETLSSGYIPSEHSQIAQACRQYEERILIPSLPGEMAKTFREIRAIIKYVDLKIAGEALGRVLGARRTECHMDLIKHANLEEIIDGAFKKTLIFTSFVNVVKALEERLVKNGYRPVVIYGETNKDLGRIVGQFEKDIQLNPAIATYPSLSEAVPMTMANTVIFIDTPFRDHTLTQAKARVARLGQDSKVFFYYMTLDTGNEANISTRSKDILAWCKEQVEAMTGQSPDLYTASMKPSIESFLDQLGAVESEIDVSAGEAFAKLRTEIENE